MAERTPLQTTIERAARELPGVVGAADGDAVSYAIGGRRFAVVRGDRAAFRLRPEIGEAAARTPDVGAASEGPGWVELAPSSLDRFALDRAEAWFVSACRHAGEDAV